MVDTKMMKLFLQAWATDEVDGRKLNGKEVDRIVNAIFKKVGQPNEGGQSLRRKVL